MPAIPADKLQIGKQYVRSYKRNGTVSRPGTFIGLRHQGFAAFNSGQGGIVSNNPLLYNFYNPDNKNIPLPKKVARERARNIKSFMLTSRGRLTENSNNSPAPAQGPIGAGAGAGAGASSTSSVIKRRGIPEGVQSKIVSYLSGKNGSMEQQMNSLRKNATRRPRRGGGATRRRFRKSRKNTAALSKN